MSKGLEKYKAGDFNDCSEQKMPDGSTIYTIIKRSENKVYRFRVKNLNQPDEEELEME